MKRLILPLLLVMSACTMTSNSGPNTEALEKADLATASLRANELLAPFFDSSVGYVVFPRALRVASGFGGAYGRGILFEGGEPRGRVRMLQFSAGANVGGQTYRQIIFFKTQESLQAFKKGNFEFAGQANAALVNVGASLTPAYNSDIALFTEVEAGLLLEASVGAHRYDYFEFVPSDNASERHP